MMYMSYLFAPQVQAAWLRILLFVMICISSSGCSHQFFYHNLMESANKEFAEGNYKEAERLYKKALDEASALGSKDLRLCDVRVSLGDFYFHQVRFSEAENLYKAALEQRTKERPLRSFEERLLHHAVFDPLMTESEELQAKASLLEKLATCRMYQGKYADSIALLKEAKSALLACAPKKSNGAEAQNSYVGLSTQILRSLNSLRENLALSYISSGMPKEAQAEVREIYGEKSAYHSAEESLRLLLIQAMIARGAGELDRQDKALSKALLYSAMTWTNQAESANPLADYKILTEFGPAKKAQLGLDHVQSVFALKSVRYEKEIAISPEAKGTFFRHLGILQTDLSFFRLAEDSFERALAMDKLDQDLRAKRNESKFDNLYSPGEAEQTYASMARLYRLSGREAEGLKMEELVRKVRKERERRQHSD